MKNTNKITVFIVSAFFLVMSLTAIVSDTPEYSDSERRVLASMPEFNVKDVFSGKFAKDFDEYTVDRFPGRDYWRSIKAYTKTGVFLQKDNNKIYSADGHLSKIEYPMNQEMLDYATGIFASVKEQYLNDNDIYLAIIPDKNRYLAEENGYLALDYAKLADCVAEKMDYAEYIEIADLLDASDYYNTDTHWRQDKIVDVAERIAAAMDVDIKAEYKKEMLGQPFNGVYVGQAAIKVEPDTISYLTNNAIENVVLEGAQAVYDMDKAVGKDPYEMFLSGNQPVITIKNKENESGRRLVVFRDSFGSSIAPLWIEGYSEIVLVDLRYISSDMLDEYVDFTDADVLFLYSTMMLNNSRAMR